jgi:FkbM family methyltransferase
MSSIFKRISEVLRFANSGQSVRDKITCGLVGLATPLSATSRRPPLGMMVPDLLRIHPSRLRGMGLLINPHDWSQTIIYDEIFVGNGYDFSLVGFEPQHVVDCGGHVGMFSLLAAATFPKAKVTVFEPNPYNFARIREHCTINRLDWNCQLGAVGAKAGETRLDIVNSHHAVLSAERGVPTQVFELAAFIKGLAATSLVLKIDVEGEERSMWQELIPILPAQTVVFFETHHGSEGWSEAEKQFASNGFKACKLVERGKFYDGYAKRITA